MDKFIHQENLALFKKRLAEANDLAKREMLLKLQAEELAKELRPIRVLLFRTDDIDWGLTRNPQLDMFEIVRRKWRAALELGIPDYLISRLPE